MHKARRVEDLAERALARAERLRGAALQLQVPLAAGERPLAAFLVFESQTLWVNFARSYFLSCALGAKSPDGGRVAIRISRSLQDERDALRLAVGVPGVTSSRGEPIWHDFTMFSRVMKALNLADPTRLTTVLGYPTSMFKDMNPCRNFFAHRSMSAAAKVKTVARRNGIDPRLPAGDVVSSWATGRSQPLVADWLDDLIAMVQILAVP